MSNILTLNNFTVSIDQKQLSDVLKVAVEQSNPGFKVEQITFDVAPGYAGDYREPSQPAFIRKVDIKLKRDRVDTQFGR